MHVVQPVTWRPCLSQLQTYLGRMMVLLLCCIANHPQSQWHFIMLMDPMGTEQGTPRMAYLCSMSGTQCQGLAMAEDWNHLASLFPHAWRLSEDNCWTIAVTQSTHTPQGHLTVGLRDLLSGGSGLQEIVLQWTQGKLLSLFQRSLTSAVFSVRAGSKPTQGQGEVNTSLTFEAGLTSLPYRRACADRSYGVAIWVTEVSHK